MKMLSKGMIYLTLLTVLMACGKKNESGKTDQYNYANPYGTGVININSPYASQTGITVNQVMQENACRSGFGGYTNINQQQPYSGQRIPIQIPLTNFPSVISPNELYVGVTSYGDVGVLVGQGAGSPPLFVGYMCPRSFTPNGQGQLLGVKIGSYSKCLVKPITAATVIFPGGATADFRWPDGGSSMGQRFSFCTP